jgi:phosphoglycolate phosphatase-like HAD superfamily hydrolase
VRPDGLTDHQIGAWLLDHVGAPASLVGDIVASYESHLVEALPLRQGRVLDNVISILEAMRRDHPSVLTWLVTGNTARGGAAKLRHYGLDRYFEEGAFSERVEPRANIVRRAIDMARARVPGLQPDRALVIGDTPHDIEGARLVGARALAVASGTHAVDELAAHEPWRVLPGLPLPETFLRLATEGAE